MPETLLEVTQADREAAAEFYGPHLARPGEVPVTAHMRAGKIDESPLIQAFARHRIAALASLQPSVSEMREALAGLLAVAEMTTFSDQYPAECERARSALSPEGEP